MALLNYPVLMAADILLYQADSVPVGIDQEPHLEVAREIARRMNQDYGTNFPEPQRFATTGGYIPSLTGEGKMSKSVSGSFITLTDSLDDIRAKIRAVPTASEVGGEMSKGLKALFAFYDLFDAAKGENFKQQFQEGTLRFVELKDTLAAIIFSTLQPLQARRAELEADPEYIDRVIAEGAQKAGALAQETVTDVRRKMGLL
jgi:tryptophanyl-tRNA synthetase